MYILACCWQISFANWNESMKVYSLAAEGVKNCNKDFSSF